MTIVLVTYDNSTNRPTSPFRGFPPVLTVLAKYSLLPPAQFPAALLYLTGASLGLGASASTRIHCLPGSNAWWRQLSVHVKCFTSLSLNGDWSRAVSSELFSSTWDGVKLWPIICTYMRPHWCYIEWALLPIQPSIQSSIQPPSIIHHYYFCPHIWPAQTN